MMYLASFRVSPLLCILLGVSLFLYSPTTRADDILGEPFPDDVPQISAETPRAPVEAKIPESADSTAEGSLVPEPPIDDAFSDAVDEAVEAATTEVVRERFSNGKVKVERQVIQDADFNFVNHGPWSMWDEEGRLLGKGQYDNGKRNGRWTRWHISSDEDSEEPGPFSGPSYQNFQRPFLSQATFDQGKLVGDWQIVDAKQRKVCSWKFDADQLHGKSVWYHPNGQKRREIDFKNGILEGNWLEWDANGELASQMRYLNGSRVGPYTEKYPSGEKYCEGSFLFAQETYKLTHDWWAGIVTAEVVENVGDDRRHGRWTYWHKSGIKLSEGEFDLGQPVGRHIWWYENGQKKAEGVFIDGKRDGRWSWWHANGQKQTSGEFKTGNQTGIWLTWTEAGKLENKQDLDHPAEVQSPNSIAAQPQPQSLPIPVPVAAKPAPQQTQQAKKKENPLLRNTKVIGRRMMRIFRR